MKIQWFYSSLGNFFKNASRTLLEDIFSIYQLNENLAEQSSEYLENLQIDLSFRQGERYQILSVGTYS